MLKIPNGLQRGDIESSYLAVLALKAVKLVSKIDVQRVDEVALMTYRVSDTDDARRVPTRRWNGIEHTSLIRSCAIQ